MEKNSDKWFITFGKTYFILTIILLSSLFQNNLLSNSYEQLKKDSLEMRSVFDKLVKIIHYDMPPRQMPLLEITNSSKCWSEYQPWSKTIFFDLNLLHYCKKIFGNKGIDIVAVLLSHELMHHYLGHRTNEGVKGKIYFSDSTFKAFFKKLPETNKNNIIKSQEIQADKKGMYYAYIAGYDPADLWPEFIDKYWQVCPWNTEEYLPKEERRNIAMDVVKQMEQLLPVYDAAVNLYLTNRFELAGKLFDYISIDLKSRRILFNAGTAYASAALEYFPDSINKYIFPFQFDSDSLFADQDISRTVKRSTLPGVDSVKMRRDLLNKAERIYRDALTIDPGYAPLYMNIACIYFLLGKNIAAITMLQDAEEKALNKMDTKTYALCLMFTGIMSDINKVSKVGRNDAKKKFEDAQNFNPDLKIITYNMKVLNGEDISQESGEKLPPPSQSEKEAICNYLLDRLGGLLYGIKPVVKIPEFNNMKVTIVEKEYYKALKIELGSGEGYFFISTKTNYKGKTSRPPHLEIGSSAELVRIHYGRPFSIKNSPAAEFLVYWKNEIIFKLDPNGVIKGWTLFTTD